MPDFRIERELRKKGHRYVAGMDEAGRGAWAGPVYAAAVILPLDDARSVWRIKTERVRDGKYVSPGRRIKLHDIVMDEAIAAGVGHASAREIDEHGIVWATDMAMERALAKLSRKPDYLLIDGQGRDIGKSPHQERLTKGEWQARCIAAASIIAKVSRDRYMLELDKQHPAYRFKNHKGYGTQKHRDVLFSKGPIAGVHRMTYRPVMAAKAGLNGS